MTTDTKGPWAIIDTPGSRKYAFTETIKATIAKAFFIGPNQL